MKIIKQRPPLYAEIVKAFPAVVGQPVIFTWGDTIFNPTGVRISPELMAHEAVHSERQGTNHDSIVHWWERYLVDPGFRINEELLAHRAEYRAFVKRHGNSFAAAKFLSQVSKRLASPLYGEAITFEYARRRIIEAPA